MVSICMGVDYLKMPDGKSITIVNSSTAIEEKKKVREEDREIYIHDLMTGILISENPSAKEYTHAGNYELPPLTKLYDKEGNEIATVIGMESRKDSRTLPFSYYRVQYKNDDLESGSFLFNEEKELAAIMYTADRKYKSQGYATPVKAALREYEDFTKNGKIRRCWIGIITSKSGSLPEIESVRPELPAANGGIKKGDILLSIAGKPITNFHDTVDAFFYLVDGKPEQFSFMRDGEKLDLSLEPVAR